MVGELERDNTCLSLQSSAFVLDGSPKRLGLHPWTRPLLAAIMYSR